MTNEQTAVEWIADRFRQYQKEWYKSNWDEVIQTVLLAKEIEDKALSKEREKAKKLVEGCKFLLEFLEKHRRHVSGLGAPIHLIKQSLTEYEKL